MDLRTFRDYLKLILRDASYTTQENCIVHFFSSFSWIFNNCSKWKFVFWLFWVTRGPVGSKNWYAWIFEAGSRCAMFKIAFLPGALLTILRSLHPSNWYIDVFRLLAQCWISTFLILCNYVYGHAFDVGEFIHSFISMSFLRIVWIQINVLLQHSFWTTNTLKRIISGKCSTLMSTRKRNACTNLL